MRNEASIGLELAASRPAAPQVGVEAGFEALFREHQCAVYRWILRIVRNAATAEDLTIETFWRIYQARGRFDQTRPFEPWARRIATHVALDWLRAQPRAFIVEDDVLAQVPDSRSEDPAMEMELRRAVADAFAKLPPKLRVAASLVVLEECTHREAADALAISVGAVKLRVFRALRILRRELREQGMTP